MKFNTTEYTICSHFLSAIFNGDESGLEEDDIALLNAWMQKEGFDLRNGHFCNDIEEPNFAVCDIVGLKGDVVSITWNQRIDE